MRGGKWSRFLVFALVVVFVLGTVFSAQADSLDDYFDDLEAIEKRLEEMKAERQKNKSELDKLRDQLEDLNREIYNAERELAKLEEKIAQLEAEIANQEQLIADIEASIAETEERLKIQTEYLEQRLCAMYKNGTVSYLEVLFSASSFSDFLSRFSFLRMLIESDTELVAEIEETKAGLEADKALLDAELDKLMLRHEELDASRAAAEEDRAALKKKAARVKELEAAVEKELDKLNKGIAAEEADKKALEKEIKRLLEQERVRAGEPPSFFTWPVPGFDRVPYNITSPFGWRTHPITGKWHFHSGIDIARYNREGQSIGGKPIVAAASGTVDVVRNYDGGGYGIYVLISHGGGYQTLYAHMRYTTVQVGQVVQMGDVIGVVGTTGSSTGNHLHFEVRVMGEVQDPLSYEYK